MSRERMMTGVRMGLGNVSKRILLTSLPVSSSFYIVMPAKAGIQRVSLDPRFRGGDEHF
jgi:hypothetical protein